MALEKCTLQFMEPGRASEPEGQHLYWIVASDDGGPEGYSAATIVALTENTPQPTPPHVLVEGGDAQDALNEAIERVETMGEHSDWSTLQHNPE